MFLPLLTATLLANICDKTSTGLASELAKFPGLAGLAILQMEQVSLKCWCSSQPEHFQEFSSLGPPKKLVSLSGTVC